MTYDLLIDLQYPERSNSIIIKRNDNNSRVLRFRVTEGGKAFDMSEVTIASFRATKPDKTIVFADTEIKDNTIIYRMTDSVCNVTGKVTCEIALYTASQEEITSFEFYILVENLLFDENNYLSQNDLSGFKSYLSRAQLAAASAEGVRDAFIIATGKVDEILEKFQDEFDRYEEYLQGLDDKVKGGYFNGERGIQGENGKDAVMAEVMGIIGFSVEEGHLMCHYTTQEPPSFDLGANGHLLYRFED